MFKNLYPYLFSLGCAFAPAFANAQHSPGQNYSLLFQNGTFTPAANANALKTTQALAPSETANGFYFRLVQFWQIPTEHQKAEIKRQGIQLHQYMPHNAYLASLPVNLGQEIIAQLGIRAVVALEPAHKLSQALLTHDYPAWALREIEQGLGR